jgi:hypothetical protein
MIRITIELDVQIHNRVAVGDYNPGLPNPTDREALHIVREYLQEFGVVEFIERYDLASEMAFDITIADRGAP